jgi:hypothetical protein
LSTIATATLNTWIGDVEQLRITLHRLHDKRAQLPPAVHPATGSLEESSLMAAHPTSTVPPERRTTAVPFQADTQGEHQRPVSGERAESGPWPTHGGALKSRVLAARCPFQIVA